MDFLSGIEERHYAAKQRLLTAQQEKLEAVAEFIKVRAALRQSLEALWPNPCPRGEMEHEKDISAEKDISGNWV